MNKIYKSCFTDAISRMVLVLLFMGICQYPAFAVGAGSSDDIEGSRPGIGEGHNPDSPGNPGSTTTPVTKYRLDFVVNPVGAGSVNSETYFLAEGSQVNAYASPAGGFMFQNWTLEGDTVSTAECFSYVMPDHDVTLVANFVFAPTSPGNPNPEEQVVKHPVVVRSVPSNSGSFSPSSSFTMDENTTRELYAYPKEGWKLIGWTINGEEQDVTTSPITISMGEKALDITAYFDFVPSSPSNPGANYYNSYTGQVIIDTFTPGSLYGVLLNLVDDLTSVTSFIVKGEMNTQDIGCLDRVSNAATIDISRTGGVQSIPNYTFQSSSASSIVLPSTVTNFGYRVFDGCTNLTSLTIYADVPPTCTTSTFVDFNNKEYCTVYVPASACELYMNDPIWGEFTILPITADVYTLQVNIPDNASIYKNNSLELVNLNSGVRQKYVVSDRPLYTFNNLQQGEHYNIYMFSPTGLEIGCIEKVVIPNSDIEVTFDNLRTLYAVNAKVTTPDALDMTSDVTVEWYIPRADGTRIYLRKGNTLSGIPEGQQLVCSVTLNNELGVQYVTPADMVFDVDAETAECNIALEPIRSIELSGKIVDSNGSPVPYASVSVNQPLNAKFIRSFATRADMDGQWSISVLDAPETRLTYSGLECVNQTDTIGAFAESVIALDLGEVVLKSIVGARVNYAFTYREADVQEIVDYYEDYQNVVISVFNVTQGCSYTDLSQDYPTLLVLDEDVKAGDKLRLIATSKTGAFNPVEKVVTLNAEKQAMVTFDIIGKGGIKAIYEMTDNPSVSALLYTANGELLKKTDYSEAEATFSTLDDGDYILISMGQTDLMKSILRLSNFGEIGLSEGKDYVKNAVNVVSGEITEVRISEIPAFDESIFYYTNSATSFTSNKSSITTGNYLTLRATIDFKGAYKDDITNIALIVDLPETCDFVEKSVIQGPNMLPYTYQDNRLTVQLGQNYQSQTRFCVIPTAGGEFIASAFIEFDYKGNRVIQPIGSAITQVKELEINVPLSTANHRFYVSGTGLPKSTVNVVVDRVFANTVNVNSRGEWTSVCELADCENFSTHPVYAEIITENGIKLTTETKDVEYNPFDVGVRDVTMTFYNGYLHRQVTVVWDFEKNEVSDRNYYFYTTTDITFAVNLNYSDLSLIPAVWLNVWTSDGKVRSLISQYDEDKDQWIAVDKFNSSALPVNVTVTIENMTFAINADASYNELIDSTIGDIGVSDTIEVVDGSTHISCVDGAGDRLGEFITYDTPKSVETVISEFIESGYELDEYLNDDSGYIPESEDDVLVGDMTVLIDTASGSIAFISEGEGDTTEGSKVVIIGFDKEEGEESKLDFITTTISRHWLGFYLAYFYYGPCDYDQEYVKYTEKLVKYVNTATKVILTSTIISSPELWSTQISEIPLIQLIAKIKRVKYAIYEYTTHTMEYTKIPTKCKPVPPRVITPSIPPIDPILDPSGYVYEAVPGNRVEGVQASIYYKETKEDMYGDLYDDVVLWDAEEYAQQNPLFTDANGMYQWDVPQGLWQVKFEKDGYVTAYSEWLPVPPPQLDVNIGIVQNKQPEVTEARAYADGVELQFDKFMDQSTLTTDNIYVTANDEKLNGEIRLVDSALADEYASEDDDEALRYASRVRFVLEQSLSVNTGEIRLTVSRNVRSYAGIPMTETFTQVLDVEKEVQAIYTDDVKVLYGGEKEVTISALPYDAGVGRMLHVSNASSLIATIDKEDVVLDDEGKATIKVRGELPGATELTFTIADVSTTGTCVVDVVTEIVTAEAPTASRASGTAVYRGTKVALATESKDGVIYFTTDGSCPCDDNGTRRKYTVPIVINEDTHILAMTSVGDGAGDVSEVKTFDYTLKRTDVDFVMPEGWSWISHNLETDVDVEAIAAANVQRIVGQTVETVRDPEYGLVGQLKSLRATESYKVKTSADAACERLSDVAWNPSTPITVSAGWTWLGYPVGQTMSVAEAFASTKAEALDMIVGQDGFAQYDGQEWKGTLETLSPGKGYLYKSQSAKQVVYNTSIVSNAAAKCATGISSASALVVDVRKYPDVMPVIAVIAGDGTDGDYAVNAFCGTECRGIGKAVDGYMMISVYGNAGERITLRVTNASGDIEYVTDAELTHSGDGLGTLAEPYVITVNGQSGLGAVAYSGKVSVTIAGDVLRIRGIEAEAVELVEVYDTDGHKLLRAEGYAEGGIRVPRMGSSVYVVVVKGNGEYTYHKVIIR